MKNARSKSALILFFISLLMTHLSAQNVGIGTTNPTHKLHVNGDMRVENGQIVLENNHIFGLNTLQGHSGLFLRANQGNATLMSLTTNGNVGIGANNPTNKLHINGDMRLSNGQIFLENNHIFGLNTLQGQNGLFLRANQGNSTVLFLATTGNMGIGTTNPASKLHVNGDMRVENGELRLENGQIVLANNHIIGLNTLQGQNGLFLRANQGNSTLMALTPDGNINLSGATASIFGVHALRGTSNGLHLQGDANSNSDLFVAPNGDVKVLQRFSVKQEYNDVALNVRSSTSDLQIFHAEGATGVPVFEVFNNSDVQVRGRFFVINGSKNFLMDHPLDPSNKTLQHACVESNEVLNVYSGTAAFDAQGNATVQLPDYFEALNKDFRYQLTCIGGFAQVYVAQEVHNNAFKISGGKPNLKVSWQVTGVRNDVWMRENPYQSEIEKTATDKGRYYYPKGFGQPESLMIGKKEDVSKTK